jgi:hypothetical protein
MMLVAGLRLCACRADASERDGSSAGQESAAIERGHGLVSSGSRGACLADKLRGEWVA